MRFYTAIIWFDHTHKSGSVSMMEERFSAWESAKNWVDSQIEHLHRSENIECINGWRIEPRADHNEYEVDAIGAIDTHERRG